MAYGNFGRGPARESRFGESRSSGGFSGGFERQAPVHEGEELDVKIEAIASKGDGIAKKEGFVIFVPKTKVGDTVKIRISKVMRRVAFADVVGQAQSAPESSETTEKPADSESFGDEESPESETSESSDSENFGDQTD